MTVQVEDSVAPSRTSRFAYDVFVVHAAVDEPFVCGYLLPRLGLANERVCRLQNLELGQLITEEIERGVRSSQVTLVVLSTASMEDRWVAFGEQLAGYASVAKDVHGVLLPLLLEDCQLTMHAQSLVKLDFRDPSRAQWEAEIERLRGHLDGPAVPEESLECPYPGMRPFTKDDAGRFFGRDSELDSIFYRLRHGEREIYVIGPSGSGKSSLMAAGLMPRLTRGVEGMPRFHARCFRPGEQPLDRLAGALEGEVAALPVAVGQLLARHAPATSLLLVVDQLEELFAVASAEQRRDFLATLRELRADQRCVLVFTLRADFYGEFMTSSLWTDRDGRISRVDLGPPSTDGLRAVIERPARDLGVYVQPELVSRLLDDAAREPGALPLLQEMLFQLWGKRRARLLALADYQALSHGARTGLAFAVGQHADFVLGRLTPQQRVTAFRILIRLVNFGEGRADTRRQQPRDALRSTGDTTESFDTVLQCLVDHRLVTVTGDDQHGDVRVDFAHEILIQAWSALATWTRTWRAHEQHRRDLEAAAVSWRTSGGGDDGLLGPVRLAAAIAWREEAAQDLGHTADLAAFFAASEAGQRRAIQQRRRTRLALAAVPFAVVTSLLALVAYRNATTAEDARNAAEVQRRAAVEQRNERNRLVAESVQLYQDVGWQQLTESERPLQALPYLVASAEAAVTSGGTPSSAVRMLFAISTRNLPITPPLRHDSTIISAVFSPDNTRALTADIGGVARIWDSATGKRLFELQHEANLTSATFSSDGTRILTASADRTARVWNAANGKPVSPLLRHEAAVLSAAFSPDNTHVVTASADKTARVWDAINGMPLFSPLRHAATVLSASFSPDGTRVVTAAEDKTARVWDAASGKPISPLLRHRVVRGTAPHNLVLEFLGGIPSAAFSPDGTRVVTTCLDKTAFVWDAVTGEPMSPPLQHQATVLTAAFSPDGARLLTSSVDRTARVWDVVTGKPLFPPLQHQHEVASAMFSSDGARIATASGDTVYIWDAETGKPLPPSLQHQDDVTSIAFSSDRTRIVTTSGVTARVWNAAAGNVPRTLQHPDAVVSAAFSPDGTRVVTACLDKTVRVWDVSTGKPLFPPQQHRSVVRSAVFSSDGTRIVTADVDSTRVWDAGTGQPLSPPLQHQGPLLSWLEHHAAVPSAVFSHDGTRVVTAYPDNEARVWDATSGKLLTAPLEHRSTVLSAAFSSDGTRIVTASADNTARVWDSITGKPLTSLLKHQVSVLSATFSSDGTRVVTASLDQTARVWDAVTGNPISPPLQHAGAVLGAAFSPDGTRVVTASDDKTAHVWDAASGKSLSPPLQHRDSVASATFSPDGTLIVTASADNTARIWDANGKPLSPPLQHQGPLASAMFSSDGTRIVTASTDNTARVWDVPLASGMPVEWRAIMDRTSPFMLVNGVLTLRNAEK